MTTLPTRPPAVKWIVDVYKRGRVRIKRRVEVTFHNPVKLEEGGEDLAELGTGWVLVTGWRPGYVGVVTKEISVKRGNGQPHTSRFTYHETLPQGSRAKAKELARGSVLAGQRFEELWAVSDDETRNRWRAMAFRKAVAS
jgi:hypothetical protein